MPTTAHGEGSLTVAVSDDRAILDRLPAAKTVLADDMEAARFAFNRYMSNLQQIREFLGATPTVAKLEAMTDLLSTSQAQSRELQGRLDALVRSIDALAATTREAYIDQPATQ